MIRKTDSPASWEQDKQALEEQIGQLQEKNQSLRRHILSGEPWVREILENVGDALTVLDHEWRFLYANGLSIQTSGLTLNEIVGKNFWEVFPKVIGTEAEKIYRRVMEDKSPCTFQTKGVYIDRWFTIDVRPIREGIFISAVDCTDQKLAEEGLAKMAKFPGENPYPILRISAEGQLLYANPSSQVLLRVWKREAKQAIPQEILGEVRECLGKNVIVRKEIIVKSKFFSLSFVPIREQQYVNVYGIDITARRKMEDALRESENRFRTMADGTPVIIWVTDALGGIEFVNRAYTEFFGVTQKQVQESGWTPLVHSEDTDRYVNAYLHAHQERDVFRAQGRVVRRDGTWRWIDSHGMPRFSASGEFMGMVGSSFDITDRVQMEDALRDSEKQYRELVQTAGSAIIRWDRNGIILFFNEYAKKFFGYSEENIIGKHVSILVPRTESTGADLSTLAQEIIDHPERYENNVNENILSDGRRVWMAWTNHPLFDEKGSCQEILAVGIDITDRRNMERALEEYNRQLEQSNEDLERFAYVASHELQEPLRKIKAFGERVTQKLGDQIDPESKDFLQRTRNASQRMQSMIDGLLELSQVTTKGRPFITVNLDGVANEVVAELDERIQACSGQIVLSELPEIQADPVQMHQLFENLIGNALKFHKPGIPPVVEVYARLVERSADNQPALVKIYFGDNGIGFDELMADRIFFPLERLVGRTEFEGTGIGLAICKKIVERHGGSITTKSKPGDGSTFMVTLPARTTEWSDPT